MKRETKKWGKERNRGIEVEEDEEIDNEGERDRTTEGGRNEKDKQW